MVKAVRQRVAEFTDDVVSFSIQKHYKNKRIRIQIVARVSHDQTMEGLIDALSDVEGVRSLKVE